MPNDVLQAQMQMAMQSEDLVTAYRDQVPVILLQGPSSIPTCAQMLVNFLRFGCPAVQVLLSSEEPFSQRCRCELPEILSALQLPDESFNVDDLPGDGVVVKITRTVPAEERAKIVSMEPISTLDIPYGLKHLLSQRGIETITDLTQRTADELLKIHKFGYARLVQVCQALSKLGLKLRGD